MSFVSLFRRGRSMVAAALLLLAALPAAADYKDDYLDGLNAIDKGRWDEAATLLRKAMAGEATENARIRFYGVRFEPYLVHYHLGRTLVKLGQCEEAIAQFDESERQGVIQGIDDLYGQLKAARDQCRATVRPPAPTVSAPPPVRQSPTPGVDPRLLREAQLKAQTALADATRSEQAVKNRQQRDEYRQVYEQRRDLSQRVDSASAKLKQARDLMDQGGREQRVADLESAASLAAEARQELDTIQQAADTARSQLGQESEQEREARRQALLREVSSLVGPAERMLAEGQALPQPGRDRIVREHRTVELVVAQAKSSDSLSVLQLEALKSQLEDATRDLREAMQRAAQEQPLVAPSPTVPGTTEPPVGRPETPAALRTAVSAYLRADYRATVEALARADFPQPRAAAVALLFRAAARYFLYLEGGSRTAELKESAAEDVRATRTKDPAVAPLKEYFSPAFIEFFNSVR